MENNINNLPEEIGALWDNKNPFNVPIKVERLWQKHKHECYIRYLCEVPERGHKEVAKRLKYIKIYKSGRVMARYKAKKKEIDEFREELNECRKNLRLKNKESRLCNYIGARLSTLTPRLIGFLSEVSSVESIIFHF